MPLVFDTITLGPCHSEYSTVTVVIDVNGNKKPNKVGRDIFVLGVKQNGNVIPAGSTMSIADSCSRLEPGAIESCINRNHWSSNSARSCITRFTGCYCAGRIVENGWKMDY